MPNHTRRKPATTLNRTGKTVLSTLSLIAFLGGWHAIGHRETVAVYPEDLFHFFHGLLCSLFGDTINSLDADLENRIDMNVVLHQILPLVRCEMSWTVADAANK